MKPSSCQASHGPGRDPLVVVAAHRHPADLGRGEPVHAATQRGGQRLRAEADAEHGHVRGVGGAQPLDRRARPTRARRPRRSRSTRARPRSRRRADRATSIAPSTRSVCSANPRSRGPVVEQAGGRVGLRLQDEAGHRTTIVGSSGETLVRKVDLDARLAARPDRAGAGRRCRPSTSSRRPRSSSSTVGVRRVAREVVRLVGVEDEVVELLGRRARGRPARARAGSPCSGCRRCSGAPGLRGRCRSGGCTCSASCASRAAARRRRGT